MAGQDYTKRLSAGGIQPVNISGDYIFVSLQTGHFP